MLKNNGNQPTYSSLIHRRRSPMRSNTLIENMIPVLKIRWKFPQGTARGPTSYLWLHSRAGCPLRELRHHLKKRSDSFFPLDNARFIAVSRTRNGGAVRLLGLFFPCVYIEPLRREGREGVLGFFS